MYTDTVKLKIALATLSGKYRSNYIAHVVRISSASKHQ